MTRMCHKCFQPELQNRPRPPLHKLLLITLLQLHAILLLLIHLALWTSDNTLLSGSWISKVVGRYSLLLRHHFLDQFDEELLNISILVFEGKKWAKFGQDQIKTIVQWMVESGK